MRRVKIRRSPRVLLQIHLRAGLGLLMEEADRPWHVARGHLTPFDLESRQR